MATTVARLEAILSANTRDFDRAMTKSETRMKKVGGAAKLMGVALAGAAVVELKRSVDAAMDAERAQTRLETAFKGAKVSIDPYRQAIEKASTAAINLGFDDEALKDSIGSLIIATGDYKKAQDAATVAMDLARFKGVSLEQGTKMLTMAMAGSQRAVKQLGISVPPVTTNYDKLKATMGKHIDASEKARLATAKLADKQATAAAVIETVRQKVRGQADAYSKTAQGEMEVFSAKVEELEEMLGEKLLPKLTQVVGFLIKMADALEHVDKWMGKVGANKGLVELVGDAWKYVSVQINRADRALKSFLDRLGSLAGPSGLDVIHGIGKRIGDASGSFHMPSIGGPRSISPRLYDELAGATAFGLTLTSGYRPGAVTKHGTPSDHGIYPSHAIDVAGPPNRMASFFRWLIGQTDVKQAFYDPLGSIFGGALSSYREGGHSDHVHVATYDKGGWLQPGLTLAHNGTGRPERVGRDTVRGITINFNGPVFDRDKQIVQVIRNAIRRYEINNGREAFGF